MKLRSSPPSPFGRKVKIAAKLLGLYDQITVENGDTKDPQDALRQQNPLGKIPILILQDGDCIYDSRVILDHLNELAQGSLIPKDSTERRKAQTLQALADGLMDASILIVYETRMRPDNERSPSWIDYQSEKITRSLDHLEHQCANPQSGPELNLETGVHVGHIALACALGYRDLRFGTDWRTTYPNLATWLAAFEAKVPAFAQTKFDPDA
ncbi:MAG: glutathione S-transferase family protein [Cohaesibacter sp.]|nr:glutathione S-transferase family protein [Cohaesibacter sp.]